MVLTDDGARLPKASRAVTVMAVVGSPAVAVAGPVIANLAAGAGVTVTVVVAFGRSGDVAVSVCTPAVSRTPPLVIVWTPASAAVNVYDVPVAGFSGLLKPTVPRKFVATFPFASRAVTVTGKAWPATAVAGAFRLSCTALPTRERRSEER